MYCGFDLSTQQLKALVVDSRLRILHETTVSFDEDLPQYKTKKGVYAEGDEVKAPVDMWLQAVDLVFERMKQNGVPLHEIKAMSGAGQQHGSVYWRTGSAQCLKSLQSTASLKDQLGGTMYPFSPNWQDSSTQSQCEQIEDSVGGPSALADLTGSRAYHRFTGPQILKLRQRDPDAYRATERISLVSSWIASVLLGDYAMIDISDACGMNLWDILHERFDDGLLETVGGDARSLSDKLGPVCMDGGSKLGKVSTYFVEKYGLSPDCYIVPFTGDNPATILSLPLRKDLDAMVSLGTSTTLLMATSAYVTSPNFHLFAHPTTKGLFMSMLCYKNGSLAREYVRNEINRLSDLKQNDWSKFNELGTQKPPMLSTEDGKTFKFGFYFPLPEIIPIVNRGIYRYIVHSGDNSPQSCFEASTKSKEALDAWDLPWEEPRAILDSQFLDIRCRAQPLLQAGQGQPGRIYAVGGASKNPSIVEVMGQVIGGTDGVFRPKTGASNACAHGGAAKAAWAHLRKDDEEKFEDFVLENWVEEETVERIGQGYQEGIWERYRQIEQPFLRAEAELEHRYHY